jgi:hypothetical protein
MIIGMVIMGFLGYQAIRDAIKVGRRIQTKPALTVQNPD